MNESMEERGVFGDEEKSIKRRSLEKKDNEGKMFWDVIAEKYPNAAPLLCEMDAAIERAEKVLLRLRSDYYCNKGKEIERTSSDESEQMLSANSGTSFSTSEELHVANAATRTSDECVASIETENSSSSSLALNQQIDRIESTNSNFPFVSTKTIDDSTNTDIAISQNIENPTQKNYLNDNSTITNETPLLLDSENISEKKFEKNSNKLSEFSANRDCEIPVIVKQSSSLEKWDKVVGGKSTNSDRLNVKRAVAIIPTGSSKRPDEKNPDKTIPISPRGTRTTQDGRTVKSNLPTTETILEPKRRAKSTPDSSPIRESNNLSEANRKEIEEIRNERGKMESGDIGKSLNSPTRTTAIKILDEYAKKCNESVIYKVVRNKKNSCEILCTFAEHRAESIGNSEPLAREAVATDILKLLAEIEMDEGQKKLAPLSNEQMRNIVFLTGDHPENAMRKLYKLCLEKNMPKPMYIVQQLYEKRGVKHRAEVKAFNETGVGIGIRPQMAKICAAEDLYRKLCTQHH